VQQSRSKYREAEELYRQGLETLSRGTAEDRQRATHGILQLAYVVPDSSQTERLHQEAILASRTAYPPNDPNIAHALTAYAIFLRDRRRYAEAEPFFREAYDIHHQAVPADHHWLGASAVYLGNLLNTFNGFKEAEPLLREAVAEYQLEDPPRQSLITWARMDLARCLIGLGRFAEAEKVYLDSMSFLQRNSRFFDLFVRSNDGAVHDVGQGRAGQRL
jgi:tetratricopeptide (TPR) repeat protein